MYFSCSFFKNTTWDLLTITTNLVLVFLSPFLTQLLVLSYKASRCLLPSIQAQQMDKKKTHRPRIGQILAVQYNAFIDWESTWISQAVNCRNQVRNCSKNWSQKSHLVKRECKNLVHIIMALEMIPQPSKKI